MTQESVSKPQVPYHRCWIQRQAYRLAWVLVFFATVWATAALYFDLPFPSLRTVAAIAYLIAVIVATYFARRPLRRMLVCVAAFLLVLIWWLSIKPSNARNWQADVAQTPWAEISGDRVTLHNFRNCDYRAEFDYTCSWTTRTLDLSQLRGVDVFVTYWGSPWILHPILSFRFGDHDYVAASIETRKEVGEEYSAVRGFFRYYELIYVFADERDLLRLRSNYRKGEEVYGFRTTAGPEWSRELFLEYLRRANDMHEHPQWYNAATDNCTTNIFTQMAATGKLPAGSSLRSWWILLNGRGTQMLYESGNFQTGPGKPLPYEAAMEKAHINAKARIVNEAPDFSQQIREGRPGFAEIK